MWENMERDEPLQKLIHGHQPTSLSLNILQTTASVVSGSKAQDYCIFTYGAGTSSPPSSLKKKKGVIKNVYSTSLKLRN